MSANKPRVSLGMPVYNGEKYLEETLGSILAQTYQDFELVISDNGSTDRTQQICERYAAKDERIKYYRNSKNIGIAPNFNRVFELCSGEYFKWTDYDDLLAPDFVTKCVEGLDQYPDAAVCFPKTRLIDENGDLIRDFEPPAEACSPEPHIRFKSLILDPDHIVSQASGLMRADLVRRTVMHGSYPCSDEVFLAHLSLLGRFYEIPERLFFYRIHPRQSTKGILASERARVYFFDTSLQGKIVLIKWLYFKNCLIAIRNSPISFSQKMMCYFHMFRWLWVAKNLKSLGKDLLLAVHERIPLFPRIYRETLEIANRAHHYK
ncbi:MAG: glycosyltransferase [candidate division KSB1 bacterium]|nr:glycosyltransferase [candidate division KSB1 bacterium]